MTPQDAALLASLIRHTDAPWKVEGTPGIDGLYDVWTALGERVCGRVPPIYTALIATAPDLHRIATEQAVENERLREERDILLDTIEEMQADRTGYGVIIAGMVKP